MEKMESKEATPPLLQLVLSDLIFRLSVFFGSRRAVSFKRVMRGKWKENRKEKSLEHDLTLYMDEWR